MYKVFGKKDTKEEERAMNGAEKRHCDLCGSPGPAVRCDRCNSQVFCLSCDDMYHRHPKRKTHLRKAVAALPAHTRPPSSKPPPGDPAKMPVAPPRKKKSFLGTLVRGTTPPSSDPNKKESYLSDKLGTIKRIMLNRPLPPLPPDSSSSSVSDVSEPQLYQNVENNLTGRHPHSASNPNLSVNGDLPVLPPKQHPSVFMAPGGTLQRNFLETQARPPSILGMPVSRNERAAPLSPTGLSSSASDLQMLGPAGYFPQPAPPCMDCLHTAGPTGTLVRRSHSIQEPTGFQMHQHPGFFPFFYPPYYPHPHFHDRSPSPALSVRSQRRYDNDSVSSSRSRASSSERHHSSEQLIRRRSKRQQRVSDSSEDDRRSSSAKPDTDDFHSFTEGSNDEDGTSSASRSDGPTWVPDQAWQCAHCTLVNPAGVRICEVCCKTAARSGTTSDKKQGKRIIKNRLKLSKSELENLKKKGKLTEEEKKKSQENQNGNATPPKKAIPIEEQSTNGPKDGNGQNLTNGHRPLQVEMEKLTLELEEAEKQISRGLEELLQLRASNQEAGEVVKEEEPNHHQSGPHQETIIIQHTAPTENRVDSFCQTQRISPSPSPVPSLSEEPRNLVRSLSRTSLMGGPKSGRYGNMVRSLSRVSLMNPAEDSGWQETPPSKQDYYLSMEKLVERRRQQTMKSQGLELVQMIRESEKRGYTPDDLQAALHHCGEQNRALEWLEANWRPMVTSVETLARRQLDPAVPLSTEEALAALRSQKGNVWGAVNLALETRQKKIQELESMGPFNRKAIAESLATHGGKVEAAFADLHHPQPPSFLMKIWGPGCGVDNKDQPPSYLDDKTSDDLSDLVSLGESASGIADNLQSEEFEAEIRDTAPRRKFSFQSLIADHNVSHPKEVQQSENIVTSKSSSQRKFSFQDILSEHRIGCQLKNNNDVENKIAPVEKNDEYEQNATLQRKFSVQNLLTEHQAIHSHRRKSQETEAKKAGILNKIIALQKTYQKDSSQSSEKESTDTTYDIQLDDEETSSTANSSKSKKSILSKLGFNKSSPPSSPKPNHAVFQTSQPTKKKSSEPSLLQFFGIKSSKNDSAEEESQSSQNLMTLQKSDDALENAGHSFPSPSVEDTPPNLFNSGNSAKNSLENIQASSYPITENGQKELNAQQHSSPTADSTSGENGSAENIITAMPTTMPIDGLSYLNTDRTNGLQKQITDPILTPQENGESISNGINGNLDCDSVSLSTDSLMSATEEEIPQISDSEEDDEQDSNVQRTIQEFGKPLSSKSIDPTKESITSDNLQVKGDPDKESSSKDIPTQNDDKINLTEEMKNKTEVEPELSQEKKKEAVKPAEIVTENVKKVKNKDETKITPHENTGQLINRDDTKKNQHGNISDVRIKDEAKKVPQEKEINNRNITKIEPQNALQSKSPENKEVKAEEEVKSPVNTKDSRASAIPTPNKNKPEVILKRSGSLVSSMKEKFLMASAEEPTPSRKPYPKLQRSHSVASTSSIPVLSIKDGQRPLSSQQRPLLTAKKSKDESPEKKKAEESEKKEVSKEPQESSSTSKIPESSQLWEDKKSEQATLPDKAFNPILSKVAIVRPRSPTPVRKEDRKQQERVASPLAKRPLKQIILTPKAPKKDVEFERKVRELQSSGRCDNLQQAEMAARLLAMDFSESDVLQAAQSCSSVEAALTYLQQECELCAGTVAFCRMESMLYCPHRACHDCLRSYFSLQIRDRNILEMLCPFCNEPDLRAGDEDIVQDYFNLLDGLLRKLVDDDTYQLFQQKLRDRVLMKDPNFRWCSKCSSGFIIANPWHKKFQCPDCGALTCGQCRKPWEDQHESISCEDFQAWKDSNNPETQAVAVTKLLTENAIDCPNCHFRYSLARGGCMHFCCIQCQYDFCSGCGQPFRMGQKCPVSAYCEKLGLHAHHPRNCLFYLRDKDPEDLQALLDGHEVPYDTTAAEETNRVCQVVEQKETSDGWKDDVCGREVGDAQAGLCRVHYVEYLGQKIRYHGLDPIYIFSEDDLELVLRRANHKLPSRAFREKPERYRQRLIEIIEKELPLERIEGT